MKKVIRVIALGFVGFIVLFIGVGFVLPNSFAIERSIVINAPPEAIHPFVNDLEQWQNWAAWNKDTDPTLEYTYPGQTVGAGAIYEWQGARTGKGKLKITRTDPSRGIWADMALETDEYNATTSILYQVEDGGTKVVWVHEGKIPKPVGGYVVGYLEGILNEHFEVGLIELKQLVEASVPELPDAPDMP